jgi:hypothetical protein
VACFNLRSELHHSVGHYPVVEGTRSGMAEKRWSVSRFPFSVSHGIKERGEETTSAPATGK